MDNWSIVIKYYVYNKYESKNFANHCEDDQNNNKTY